MILTICVLFLVIIGLLLIILIKPSIEIKGHKIDIFYIPPLIGAIVLLVFKAVPLKTVVDLFTSSSSVNPIKVLILFISISMLSISLDELGFFKMLASKTIEKCKNNQYSLFFALYILISFLTIFTSNDIVILTFTPFICYFSKNAKINPIPFLVMEFVNANTYSMLLSIGNPTNIYLSQYFNISFVSYLKSMAIPTIFSGIVSFIVLLLIFNKDLKKPMETLKVEQYHIKHKALVIISLVHLIVTTILLVISNYINLQIWLICLVSACSLSVILLIYLFVNKKERIILGVYKRLPYSLIPFVLSMFIIVLAVDYNGILIKSLDLVSKFLTTKENTAISFLLASTLIDNLINNIPMSVLFSGILKNVSEFQNVAIYSTIIGSNIGAYLTPIGALAGIMWMSLLKKYDVKFNFSDFVKYGIIIVPCVLIASFLGIIIVF